jgi:succinate dehydrogenase/fumarate reductase flavoprotein subunit
MQDELELEADVLVIGGGLAGTWAAAAAARAGAEVLVVDKGFCGTSGVAANAGPGHWWVSPQTRAAAIERQMEKSRGLGESEWMERVLEITWESLPGLAAYYDFPTDDRGEVVYRALRGPEYLRAMRRLIEDLGVTVLDHSPALELLQHADGAVAGARGIRRREHRDWTVRAGAVVLATGGCGFRAHAVGAACNTGDGLLMAAEVGAELSGMEFSAMFGPAPAHTNMTRSMSFFLASYTDASGAPIPVDLTTMASDLAAALLRGPVYAQFDRMPTHFREHLKFIQPAFVVGFSRLGIDPFNERFEITLRGEGTIRGVGGIRLRGAAASVGIPGLYAAGDTTSREPVTGAVSGGGAQNSAWALTTGQIAGREAAALALADGRRSDGGVLPAGLAALRGGRDSLRDGEAREIERAVQDEMFDLDLAFWRTDEKLSGALGRLVEIWPRVRDSSRAPDRRERLRARETAAMLETARWCLTSARERVESRGMHHRADAPTELASWEHRLSVSGIDEPEVRPVKGHVDAIYAPEVTP